MSSGLITTFERKARKENGDKERQAGIFLDVPSPVFTVLEEVSPHQEKSLKHLLEKQGLPWEGQLDLKWQQELTTTDRAQGPP